MRPKSFLLLSFLALAACRHDKDVQPQPPQQTPTPTPTPTPAPTFGISGDTAVEVMQARSVDAIIFLSDSGAGLPTNFTVSGLPPGVRADFTTGIATPPNQTILRFRAGPLVGDPGTRVAPAGTYTVTAHARMTNGVEKTHSIRVTVVENPSCVELRVGKYAKSGCFGALYPVYVQVDSSFPGTHLRLSQFPDNRATYAEVNCADNTLTIPRQSIGLSTFFTATGTFNRDTIWGTGIIDNSSSGFGFDTCNFMIVRQ